MRSLVANPLFSDDNHGRQLVGRAEVRPAPGLILGASAARGQHDNQRSTALRDDFNPDVVIEGDFPLGFGVHGSRI